MAIRNVSIESFIILLDLSWNVWLLPGIIGHSPRLDGHLGLENVAEEQGEDEETEQPGHDQGHRLEQEAHPTLPTAQSLKHLHFEGAGTFLGIFHNQFCLCHQKIFKRIILKVLKYLQIVSSCLCI